MDVKTAYEILYTGILIFIAILTFVTFIRVIRGPLMADRVVGINTIGTLIIMMVCVLSMYLDEPYLLDVALIYAMISFLAVVVLTKIYSGVYKNRIERARIIQETEKQEAIEHAEKADFEPVSVIREEGASK